MTQWRVLVYRGQGKSIARSQRDRGGCLQKGEKERVIEIAAETGVMVETDWLIISNIITEEKIQKRTLTERRKRVTE